MGTQLTRAAMVFAGIVFAVSAAYAIKGGPPYPSQTNVVGTYAGVLSPTPTPNPAEPPPATPPCSANSIGVFSVGVPSSGVATGTFVMFSQGRVFSGTIQGIADAGNSSLRGVLAATYNFTVNRPNPVTGENESVDVTATANGSLKSKIAQTDQNSLGTAATRIRGLASLDISQGFLNPDLTPFVDCASTYRVTGFKQSSSEPTTTTITPPQ
jgi:hypothetical protein